MLSIAFLVTGEQEINALKVRCNNDENGCDWMGELRSLDNHLTTCEYALLPCTNKCTNNTNFDDLFPDKMYVLRRDMDNHLKNTCPNRQYQCPHCKDTGRHCEMTTIHLRTCAKLKIPCPNAQCNTSVPRCKLSDHRAKCPLEKLPCKYIEIGCKEKPLRKDLQQHENDDTFHLHLAIETVNKQQMKTKAIEEKMKEMEDIVHAQTSLSIFKIPKFKSLEQKWYCPSFYICPGSYKMCIYVYANGNDDGEGTHVSVYACLMRGRNDDNLSWPFRGEVTITLLNQLEDTNHFTDTLTYSEDVDDDSNRRVVDSDRGSGYGWPTFISHDQLGYDVELNCQYLKDNCLYFRVTAKAPDPVKPWLI